MNLSVAAIVLAAGASTRLGQPKQLVRVDGEPLLARAVRFASEAGYSPVIAVLGADHERIRQTVPMNEAIAVINENWRDGISTSIHAGLGAIKDAQVCGAAILTCDQPKLGPIHLRKLRERFEGAASASIVASTYAGTRGTPAVFPKALFADLLNLRGDKGARSLFNHSTTLLIEVEFPGGEIDIDTPEDLKLLG